MKTYERIALLGDALNTCEKKDNTLWADRHREELETIEKDYLPMGSGIDSGCKIVSADGNKIVISTAFHHMDQNGYYDGWTEHNIIVKPSLIYNFNISITGTNKNNIKEYLTDLFRSKLDQEWK